VPKNITVYGRKHSQKTQDQHPAFYFVHRNFQEKEETETEIKGKDTPETANFLSLL